MGCVPPDDEIYGFVFPTEHWTVFEAVYDVMDVVEKKTDQDKALGALKLFRARYI